MKLLHLVLYSQPKDNQCYDEMLAMTREYYKRFNDTVKTIYYKYADIEEDFVMQDDMLLIKGKETLIPGVLDKTIKAFEYFSDEDYDAIVRSNISTIVNFTLLHQRLNDDIPYYAGAKVENLQWTGGGIEDPSYFGTQFACGICYILSKAAVMYLIENKDKVRMDIVDDVSLALFHKEHRPDAYPPIEIGMYAYLPCFFRRVDDRMVLQTKELVDYIKNKNIIFYRNNCTFNWTERKPDAIQMRVILDFLQDSDKTP